VPADLRKRWRKADCQSWSSRPDTVMVRRSRLERFAIACRGGLHGNNGVIAQHCEGFPRQEPELELPRGSSDPLHAGRRCGPETLQVNYPLVLCRLVLHHSYAGVVYSSLQSLNAALRGFQSDVHRLQIAHHGRSTPGFSDRAPRSWCSSDISRVLFSRSRSRFSSISLRSWTCPFNISTRPLPSAPPVGAAWFSLSVSLVLISTSQTWPWGLGDCLAETVPFLMRLLSVSVVMPKWVAASVIVISMCCSIATHYVIHLGDAMRDSVKTFVGVVGVLASGGLGFGWNYRVVKPPGASYA